MAWRPTTRHRCNRFLSSIRPWSSVNFEEDSHLPIKSTRNQVALPSMQRTTFLVVRQIRSNLSIDFSSSVFPSPPPSPPSAYFRIIFGSPMFTHPKKGGTHPIPRRCLAPRPTVASATVFHRVPLDSMNSNSTRGPSPVVRRIARFSRCPLESGTS